LLFYFDVDHVRIIKHGIPSYISSLTTVVLFFVYIDKKADHVRMLHRVTVDHTFITEGDLSVAFVCVILINTPPHTTLSTITITTI